MTVCLHVYRGDPDGRTPEPGTHIMRTFTCVRCGHSRAFVHHWPARANAATAAELFHRLV
ncbi:hypothetical protein D1825_15170 [Cellulomonas rhizosphaerae]|uniref:Uncharacterized protein n=1 Tax=Cellulomonas rhizosphaerae TaxID=2293719 RepID=A0A413RIE0_9CELL|nr:hypothetical protein D1825_15170 [Cellulomonas rhizosphaerae]